MQERRQFDFKPVINENTNKYFEKYQQKNIDNDEDNNNKIKKEKSKEKNENNDNKENK